MIAELPTVETAKELGLLPEEYDKIVEILGRKPNFTELSIYSVMWSEHCSYKNSIIWLKTLPKKSTRMMVEAGQENAGLVDIGDGLGCVFKIESHNHPSALEPYQGAATGVGGINRDIFTMGARPIAQLNSLKFGNIESEKTKWLLRGVVKGIGDYGNAFGIPTVGGEVFFDDCYNINPLVNAFSAGIVRHDKTASATSKGKGNLVYIIGSATGKDGIHGAAFASKDISEDSINDLPAVQVGDPFQEKLLLEATLEIIESGCVVGMQDMGAAGITCSTSEMSGEGEFGMDIYLDRVPMRQADMKPFEILLSESQERMLIVVEKGKEQALINICEKWDILFAEIGVVTLGGNLKYFMNGELVAETPAKPLVLGGGAPVYEREYEEPPYFKEYKKFNIDAIKEPKLEDLEKIAKFLLVHPNIASKKWVYSQYDSMVGTANMNANGSSDAGVVAIKGTNKAIAITTDCNPRYVHADPEEGTAMAVAEAARNVVCAGGEPLAITNCLNFGNPYNKHVYWQFVHAIKGMSKACLKLNTPVTGGNVSFYNQSSDEGPVFPTPVIGMLGLLEDQKTRMTLDFKRPGDLIYLLGKPYNCISSSEYLYSYHKVKASPAPMFNLDDEFILQQELARFIKMGLIKSAHDISDGGLFVALAESAMAGNLGFDIMLDDTYRRDAYLFGESQSRVIVSVSPKDSGDFEDMLEESKLKDYIVLGEVTKDGFMIDEEIVMLTSEAKDLYNNALGDIMEGK